MQLTNETILNQVGQVTVRQFKSFDGKTLFKVVECVAIHKGQPLTMDWECIYSTYSAALSVAKTVIKEVEAA